MCGIAGVVSLRASPPPDRLLLERMAGALSHRGPDEFGIYRDDRAGLAHARLSIIDLSSGQQPLSNEDRTLWIVFNGEIFNYLELRQELRGRGHAFRTESDTEVIVHAYEQWGEDAFGRFNGQWALALWDARRERLVLSRDPYGIAPLYIAEHDGHVYFASEVKALFQDGTLPRRLDPRGMAQVFTFWAPIAPRTVFGGVEELEPGHTRTYRATERRNVPHFTPNYESAGERVSSVTESAVRVRHSLDRATALRMLRADVPVGSYLSGGLDSSLVAALGHAAVGRSFKTFSLRFADAEFDETAYQRLVASRLGTEHHDVVVTRRDIATYFPAVVRHAERPLLRTAAAPLFLLSKLVRDEGIKVVLTGEGADEMFAGYDLFREGKIRRFWARRPDSRLRPLLLERLYPYLARSPVRQRAMAREFFGVGLEAAERPGFAHGPRWRSTSALWRLFHPDLRARVAVDDPTSELLDTLPKEFERWSPLSQDQYLECRTLLSAYLLCSQGDRMLMAHSVEGRFPFLDPEVVALANQLPDTHKLHVLDEKHVLKRAAADVLPQEILRRPKQPYRAPDAASFFAGGAPDWIESVVTESALRDAGVFDVASVRRLFDKCRSRGSDVAFSNTDNMAIVGILSTQLLDAIFIRSAPYVSPAVRLKTDIERTTVAHAASPGAERAV